MTDDKEKNDARSVGARLDTHEAVCAERYGHIKEALDTLGKRQTTAMIMLVTLLLSALGTLIARYVLQG